MKYYIYQIIDKNNNEEFYIGSTNNISARKSKHKKTTNNKVSKRYWTKLYKYIRENGNWECFEVIIIESGECDTKLFMRQKEQEYINNMKPTLNSISACK